VRVPRLSCRDTCVLHRSLSRVAFTTCGPRWNSPLRAAAARPSLFVPGKTEKLQPCVLSHGSGVRPWANRDVLGRPVLHSRVALGKGASHRAGLSSCFRGSLRMLRHARRARMEGRPLAGSSVPGLGAGVQGPRKICKPRPRGRPTAAQCLSALLSRWPVAKPDSVRRTLTVCCVEHYSSGLISIAG
jgi:hypothetical protein